MRKRFLRHGLASFEDHNVLELLLFYALPRRDTNLVAHELMDTFGGLDGVFAASAEELMQVPGIGENAAALIRLVPEAAQRYLVARESISDVLPDVESAGRYLLPHFMNCTTEIVMLLCLDPKLKVVDCRQVGSGGMTSASFRVRDIVQTALQHNAKYAVLAHNHLSGVALPSQEDRSATALVRDALRMVDVTLIDHIIVAGQDFVSLADDGYL